MILDVQILITFIVCLLDKWSDADLSFEGAVQRNENSKVSLRALEEMAIIKIHKRDYY